MKNSAISFLIVAALFCQTTSLHAQARNRPIESNKNGDSVGAQLAGEIDQEVSPPDSEGLVRVPRMVWSRHLDLTVDWRRSDQSIYYIKPPNGFSLCKAWVRVRSLGKNGDYYVYPMWISSEKPDFATSPSYYVIGLLASGGYFYDQYRSWSDIDVVLWAIPKEYANYHNDSPRGASKINCDLPAFAGSSNPGKKYGTQIVGTVVDLYWENAQPLYIDPWNLGKTDAQIACRSVSKRLTAASDVDRDAEQKCLKIDEETLRNRCLENVAAKRRVIGALKAEGEIDASCNVDASR